MCEASILSDSGILVSGCSSTSVRWFPGGWSRRDPWRRSGNAYVSGDDKGVNTDIRKPPPSTRGPIKSEAFRPGASTPHPITIVPNEASRHLRYSPPSAGERRKGEAEIEPSSQSAMPLKSSTSLHTEHPPQTHLSNLQ